MTSKETTDKALQETQEIQEHHQSLKYSLLGPSLTKAGQDTVDQQKVSEIIYNASKGSKYFNNEQSKDRNLTQKIERIQSQKKQLEKLDLASDLRRADEYLTELELSRDLSQLIVHVDCDAFYAAVEELDRPELRNVPMAVGHGVLTTCNYHARKFGCRSGMAGFVAKKLCPQLITLPLNFEKYIAKATEVREILAEYDPRFESASIDEAYLNITQFCNGRNISADDAVAELRNRIQETCKITVSAGIGANAKIAKIVSNKNKPNGQFRVPNDRASIVSFFKELPIRKINGIGRVWERELKAIGIETCGDIFQQRQYLLRLFGEKAFQFLMTCYLGLGRTKIMPAEDYERKSVGTESTFRDISEKSELREKLRWLAEELEKDLRRTQFSGRTIVLKAKLHTYEVFTRQVALPKAIHLADDLYKPAEQILARLEKDMPGLRLRLMGIRLTQLVSLRKDRPDIFGRIPVANGRSNKLKRSAPDDSFQEWEVWPDKDFEEAARLELQDDMAELERLSQENESTSYAKEASLNLSATDSTTSSDESQLQTAWACPICGKSQPDSDKDFNDHIDYCLSRQAIKDAVRESATAPILDGLAKKRRFFQ